jgi:hypothetical protein
MNTSKQATPNKRRFSRIPFDAAVTLTSPNGIWHGKLLDISLKGVLTTRPLNWVWQGGDRFLVEIHPPENHFAIRMESVVAHADEHKVGLRCTHIDLDSASHLRRLVELNVGDEETLNRELAALGGGAPPSQT